MKEPDTDLLGRRPEPWELDLLEVHRKLATLLAGPLPPCAAANLRCALAACAVAVTDLGLRFEALLDLEV